MEFLDFSMFKPPSSSFHNFEGNLLAAHIANTLKVFVGHETKKPLVRKCISKRHFQCPK
jgi:hypothetical protein